MSNKPTYNLHDTGPVCAICGCNYQYKRPFYNRCPTCRRPLPGWLLTIPIGLILGLVTGLYFGRDIPWAGQVAIAFSAAAVAIGVVLWEWIIKR